MHVYRSQTLMTKPWYRQVVGGTSMHVSMWYHSLQLVHSISCSQVVQAFYTCSTSPKCQLSTVPLPDNCVMTSVFQDGSSSAFSVHSQAFKPTQASFVHTNSRHIQQATKSF